MGGEGCFCAILFIINFFCMGWVYNDLKTNGRSDTEAGLWAAGTLFFCFPLFPIYLAVRQSYVDEKNILSSPPRFDQKPSPPPPSTFQERVQQFVTPVNPEAAKKIEAVHRKLEQVLPSGVMQNIDMKIENAIETQTEQVKKKGEQVRRKAEPVVRKIEQKVDSVKQYPDIFAAIGNNAFEAARVFLDNISDINLKDSQGASILHRAAEKGNREFVETLLSKLADLNEEDNDGKTPLHRAAAQGRKEVVELLLSRGAALNGKDYDGHTPLFDAAMAGQEKIVQFLASHGAEVNIKNYEEKSLLTALSESGKPGMATLLRSLGAHDLF